MRVSREELREVYFRTEGLEEVVASEEGRGRGFEVALHREQAKNLCLSNHSYDDPLAETCHDYLTSKMDEYGFDAGGSQRTIDWTGFRKAGAGDDPGQRSFG